MPHKITLPAQRLAISKLALEIFREASANFLQDGDRFGTNSDDVLLCCAILVGQLEDRPMRAAKLATYSGIPRPTTIRKLKALEERGLVKQRADDAYVLPHAELNSNESVAMVNRMARLIVDAAGTLSKLDTSMLAVVIALLVA